MGNVPIHSQPNMHPGPHPDISCGSCQYDVAATSALGESGNSVIARMPPREHGPDEPFTCNILRLIGSVREPEARLDVASQSSVLSSFCAQERVKIFISHEALEIKKPRVSPIGRQKHIGGTGARLQTCREQISTDVCQVCAPSGEFGTERHGCLGCSTLRISPIKTVLHQSHRVPKP